MEVPTARAWTHTLHACIFCLCLVPSRAREPVPKSWNELPGCGWSFPTPVHQVPFFSKPPHRHFLPPGQSSLTCLALPSPPRSSRLLLQGSVAISCPLNPLPPFPLPPCTQPICLLPSIPAPVSCLFPIPSFSHLPKSVSFLKRRGARERSLRVLGWWMPSLHGRGTLHS